MIKAITSTSTFLLLILLLTNCATSPLGRKQLMLMSEGELNRMGLQAFQNMKRKTPMVVIFALCSRM